jgi:hypothetical protein
MIFVGAGSAREQEFAGGARSYMVTFLAACDAVLSMTVPDNTKLE